MLRAAGAGKSKERVRLSASPCRAAGNRRIRSGLFRGAASGAPGQAFLGRKIKGCHTMLQNQNEAEDNDKAAEEPMEILYFKDIEPYGLLDKSEEKAVLEKIRNGDGKARELFLESNLRLVLKVAGQFSSQRGAYLDLVQEGNIALIQAVDRFDLNSGCSFSTFAVLLIRRRIWKYILESSDNIYVPQKASALIYKINRSAWQIKNQSGRDADNREIAEKTGIDLPTVNRIRRIASKTLSLDMAVGQNQEYSLKEIIPDLVNRSSEDIAEQDCLKDNINSELLKLKPRERQVLQMRFGLNDTVPQTRKGIAKKLNVSTERIRQIENGSLEKLKKSECIRSLYELI